MPRKSIYNVSTYKQSRFERGLIVQVHTGNKQYNGDADTFAVIFRESEIRVDVCLQFTPTRCLSSAEVTCPPHQKRLPLRQ